MHRVLKPGSRPLIAFGILFGAITLLLAGVALAHGRGRAVLPPILLFVVMYAVLSAGMLRARIIVTSDAIGYRAPFGIHERRIAFSDVTASFAPVLAEPKHPVTLEIVTGGEVPAVTIRLKLFRQSDVAWLLSLPQLRARPHAGSR